MTRLVVELCGLPGSGKTTVARHTCAALEALGVPSTVADRSISAAAPRGARVLRRTAGSLRAAGQRPRWALAVGADIAAVRQPTRRDTASVLAQWLAVCDATTRARRETGVHLLEEGLLQTTWTLRLRSTDAPPPRLWASLPADAGSDLAVVLDVPVPVVESRLSRRTSRHSRSQLLPPELLRAELERGQRLLEELVAGAPVPVLRLAGHDGSDPAGLGAELADLLLPFLPAAR